MNERPIIFNDEMVRALLAGRKTQTRRPCKVNGFGPRGQIKLMWWDGVEAAFKDASSMFVPERCPYGQPGDRLWVRETWMPETEGGTPNGAIIYRATNPAYPDGDRPLRWSPAIHMPREFSRLTLEVTAARVARLQEITEADAQAEGATAWHDTAPDSATVYVPEFRLAWDGIYAKRGLGWDANPWVWAVTFKQVTR